MQETKDKSKLRLLGQFAGVTTKNSCYGNAMGLLQHFAASDLTEWYYAEGLIRLPQEPEGIHHGWVVAGRDLLDPTEPEADLIYRTLRRWPAAEFLTLVAQDIELPLTDPEGNLRPQIGGA